MITHVSRKSHGMTISLTDQLLLKVVDRREDRQPAMPKLGETPVEKAWLTVQGRDRQGRQPDVDKFCTLS